ncbi:11153_t:CDS:2, partial [Funneliformis geosporum]
IYRKKGNDIDKLWLIIEDELCIQRIEQEKTNLELLKIDNMTQALKHVQRYVGALGNGAIANLESASETITSAKKKQSAEEASSITSPNLRDCTLHPFPLQSNIEDADFFEGEEDIKIEDALLSKRSHENEEAVIFKKIKNRNEKESVEEGTSQEDLEDLLNSVTKASNAFRQIKFPTYYNKLKTIWHAPELGLLFERLSLEDENIHMEEDEEGERGDIENGVNIKDEAVSEIEKIVHNLNETATKFWFLLNTIPIPVLSYDQAQFHDINIIKNGFSTHRLQSDGVAEFFERPKQIPLFLLEVSGDPGNPGPDKFNTDRIKLMNEGVFALNKFITRTELPI